MAGYRLKQVRHSGDAFFVYGKTPARLGGPESFQL